MSQMKTLWTSIPRNIAGYNCPNCKLRWKPNEAPLYCPNCGKMTTIILEYQVPIISVKK